jgi:hypothetical protein
MWMLFSLRWLGFSKFFLCFHFSAFFKFFIFQSLREYEKGCGWEIYTTQLSTAFEGAKFSELSYALYDKIGVVLFALQIKEKNRGSSRLLLNPANFSIPSHDEYEIDAFVIAKNKASSDLSFKTSNEGEGNAIQRNFENLTNLIKSTVTLEGNAGVAPTEDRRRISRGNSMKALSPQGSLETDDRGSPGKSTGGNSRDSKWKHLKKQSLIDRKVKSSNHQEVMHRLEDEHLNKFYYIRSEPAEINSVTIKTNVLDEVPFINNHLIIIGKGLKNLYDLIRPLRARHLGPLRFIVILYPYDIPPDVWLRISIFEGLLIVRGSPLEDTNLRRAGIFRAAQVVVLADGSTESMGSNPSGMDALIDSDAIFAFQHVKRMNPQTHVVLEIVNQSNIGYLEDENNQSLVNDPRFSPQFAAGSLFTTDLLDSIVCQAYYNPDIIKVINKLISGVDQIDRGTLVKKAAAECGIGGQQSQMGLGGGGGGGDDNSSEGSSNDDRPTSPLMRMSSSNRLLKLESSCLYQMSIPENLDPKTYGALYHHLSLQGIIPLGLLRGIIPSLNMGRKSNKLPYVYTNPSKDTELYTCDKVFVLSLKPEKISSKLDVKEWLLDLQMQKNKDGKDKGKEGPDKNNPKGVDNYEKHHKKLEDKFQKFQADTTKRLSKITEIITKISDLKSQQAQQINQLNSGLNTFRSLNESPVTTRRTSFANNEINEGTWSLSRSNSNNDNIRRSPQTIGGIGFGSDSPPISSSRKNSIGVSGVESPVVSILKRPSTGNGLPIENQQQNKSSPPENSTNTNTSNTNYNNNKKRPSFSDPLVHERIIENININTEQVTASNENSDNEEDQQIEGEMGSHKTNTTVASSANNTTEIDLELDERTKLVVKTKASPRATESKTKGLGSPSLSFGRKRTPSESKILVAGPPSSPSIFKPRPVSAVGGSPVVTGPKIDAINRPKTAERIRRHRAASDEQFHQARAKRVGSPTNHNNNGGAPTRLFYSSIPSDNDDDDNNNERDDSPSPKRNNLLSKSFDYNS